MKGSNLLEKKAVLAEQEVAPSPSLLFQPLYFVPPPLGYKLEIMLFFF